MPDVLVQSMRNKRAALNLMRCCRRSSGFVPDKLVTDGSGGLMPLPLVIWESQDDA